MRWWIRGKVNANGEADCSNEMAEVGKSCSGVSVQTWGAECTRDDDDQGPRLSILVKHIGQEIV